MTDAKQTNSFLPEGYKEPSKEKFTKFKDKTTRLRILSNTVVGWFYFREGADGKSIKDVSRSEQKNATDGVIDNFGNRSMPKHFWATTVWNYNTECIQVWEISQKLIRDKLTALINNPDWADIHAYDLVITKTGEGKETKYEIVQGKESPLSKEIKEAAMDTTVDLDKLFTNEDPFS